MDDKNPDKQSKRVRLYYIAAILLILIINTVISPMFFQPKVHEVSYTNFLFMVDEGKATKVEITKDRIALLCNQDGKEQIYVTGRVDDPELVSRLVKAKVEFSQVIPKQESPIMSFFNNWILPFLLFMVIGQLIMRYLGPKLGGGNMMSFGKSNAKVYIAAQTGKTFKDVAGQDEAKEALQEIVNYLHNPSKYKAIGAVMPKGVLLVGPPGTGKTLLAKAVAGEAKVPFFSISGSEFIEMFVGMGAARVRDLGKKRDNGSFGSNDEREQTLNQLLSEMDGFDGSKGVIILAATNRPEVLDKALLRPGRFDRRVPVELPDLQGREAILKVHSHDVKMDPQVDFHTIALATSGASGAELANIVNEAALRAVRMGRSEVIQEDLEESVEVVIAGAQRKGAVISPEEKKVIAYHEIGHALVAASQKDSAPVHKITIIPRTSGALGYTMQVDTQEKVLMSREELYNKIVTLTGGRSAEEVVFNLVTSGASNDIEQATKLARAMITRFGMTDEFDMVALETVNNAYLGGDTSLACAPETAARIDEAVFAVVKKAHKEAREILEAHREKMDELAQYLLKKETITGDEFMAILHGTMKQEETETVEVSVVPETTDAPQA